MPRSLARPGRGGGAALYPTYLRVGSAAEGRMEPLPKKREAGKIRQSWQMNEITAHIDSSGT